LKKAVIPLSLTLMSFGIGLLFLARSPWTVVVAMLVFGIGSGSVTPVIFLKTAQAVPPATRALAMSIVSSCIYFGQFLMPFVFSLIGAISGNASIRSAFLVFGCCTLLAAVIALFLSLAGKRKASAYSI
jgi:MFS family permease